MLEALVFTARDEVRDRVRVRVLSVLVVLVVVDFFSSSGLFGVNAPIPSQRELVSQDKRLSSMKSAHATCHRGARKRMHSQDAIVHAKHVDQSVDPALFDPRNPVHRSEP